MMRTGLFAAAALAAGMALAQESAPLSADRPGFATSPDVVSPGTLQFEGGITRQFERSASGLSRMFAGGTPLVRAGVSERVEVRVGGDGMRTVREGGSQMHARGLSDFALGAKIRLWEERGPRPTVAVLPSLSLPVGHPAFSSGGFDPGAAVTVGHALPGRLTFGAGAGAVLASGDTGRSWQGSFSAALGRSLAGGLSGYGEICRTAGAWTVDGGWVLALRPDTEVDVSAGRAVAGPVSGWFLGAGFTVRSPLRLLFR